MLLLGVKESLQEKVKKLLNEQGIHAELWYECRGDEEVVIVLPEMVDEDGFVIELEEEE